ncbi:MAG: MmcQ/YjbR family DNA-binding protein [Alphaproteobacteria bacterium]|nr:MmcQ/YjbR family DNA-binding protein [Alphaproteobacteria bacterium]MDE2109686.1 MmcQ/YjbR family DNA-binding protein [Alphaproteobacteria bacterium]MDE2492387.1 MmcQ/YjbR family DNA-binding protein [Alphaproteobacteria bacterium]
MVSKPQFEKIALSFPGAVRKPSYGKPSILIAKKFFTRLRDEDNSLVLIVGSIDERDMLLDVDPDMFHITAHYKDYPAVLARLAKIDAKTLRGMLTQYWRRIAPKRFLKDGDDATASSSAGAKRPGKKPRKGAASPRPRGEKKARR